MLIGIIILTLIILGIVLAIAYCDDAAAMFVLTILGLVSLCALVIYGIFFVSWIGAEYKANIINREYGTHYTRAEVFYASDVIDTIRELDRKRIELNVDLTKE